MNELLFECSSTKLRLPSESLTEEIKDVASEKLGIENGYEPNIIVFMENLDDEELDTWTKTGKFLMKTSLETFKLIAKIFI